MELVEKLQPPCKLDDEKLNKIICGDNLQLIKEIPNRSINLVITSPPYNKQEKQKGWLVKNVVYDNYRDAVIEKDYQEEQIYHTY